MQRHAGRQIAVVGGDASLTMFFIAWRIGVTDRDRISLCLEKVESTTFGPLDLLPRRDLAEKLIELVLSGPPEQIPRAALKDLTELAEAITGTGTSDVKLVVFGGGTGLSNVVGGDSRNPGWRFSPFQGLKKLFPATRAITCITDDGGSTGELLKDLPIIAVGDIRHVLLSSVQRSILKEKFGLGDSEALAVVDGLYSLFNHRFSDRPESPAEIIRDTGADLSIFPLMMRESLLRLISLLFSHRVPEGLLKRNHCLGNLLIVASIYLNRTLNDEAVIRGIQFVAEVIGANPDAVLPCSSTPAQLQVLYSNGVLVTGEEKSGKARRGYPVDRVFVRFSGVPVVPEKVIGAIKEAEILIFAPGSLYTSIIPILHVPGIAEAVRRNQSALKILVANLWAQEGETDLARDEPHRRFYVSDLIRAYDRNIPSGIKDLFHHVLVLGLKDIPGSVIQNYAVEDKVPIYLDRSRVREMGLFPVEAGIFSQDALRERLVVQHDPGAFATAVHTLWAVKDFLGSERHDYEGTISSEGHFPLIIGRQSMCGRLHAMERRLEELDISGRIKGRLSEIFWKHKDIMPAHLDFMNGLRLVEPSQWRRCQKWDNILSFFDPLDGLVKIRKDVTDMSGAFETALLVALGQSLLGNYTLSKKMRQVEENGVTLGKTFYLELRPEHERKCFLSGDELREYLLLSRMNPTGEDGLVYSRLINGIEGFTPPGLLFGLMYAWYLDNRFDVYTEYKMSIMRADMSDLIPEQVKIFKRRKAMIDFFRRVVFRLDDAGGYG